jgi:L-glutamine-phosphate cytidylyltransferase
MILIYLSAGRGSRLPTKNRNNPKCLVKIKQKTLFERNKFFFRNFKKRILITGYKSFKLKKFAKKYGFEIIKNENFFRTNMVYSMFLAKKKIKQDVVVCYGDIIFDHKLFKLLREKKNILPVYSNWYSYWTRRMNKQKLFLDAEEIIVKKQMVTTIGGKISLKIPKYQFAGIIKFKKDTFLDLFKYFKTLNVKTDMTNFLDLSIKNKNLKLYIKKFTSFWYEIDSKKDILVAEKSKFLS